MNPSITFSSGVRHDPGQTDANVVPDHPGPGLPQLGQGALDPVPVLGRTVHPHPLIVSIPLRSRRFRKIGNSFEVIFREFMEKTFIIRVCRRTKLKK